MTATAFPRNGEQRLITGLIDPLNLSNRSSASFYLYKSIVLNLFTLNVHHHAVNPPPSENCARIGVRSLRYKDLRADKNYSAGSASSRRLFPHPLYQQTNIVRIFSTFEQNDIGQVFAGFYQTADAWNEPYSNIALSPTPCCGHVRGRLSLVAG